MASQSLTEARIEAAVNAADPATELRLYDTKVNGLLLRRQVGGKPRWYVFRRAHGKMRRVALGGSIAWPVLTLETARDLALAVIPDIAKGVDLKKRKAEKRSADRGGRVPMEDAMNKHLATISERGRSRQHVAELKRVAMAAKAAGIKDLADAGCAARADKWLSSLKVSELTRHRYRVHLIAIGKTAVRWWPAEVLPREPFLALSGQGAPMPAPPVFQPSEACALVSDRSLSLDATGGRLWAFLLYTGCRFKEATWARWDRIDLQRGTFGIVPPDAAEHAAGSRVKRGKSRTVHLQPELAELLRTWTHDPAETFIFPEQWRGGIHARHVIAFRSHLKALEIPLLGRRIHALRHSHACLAIASGEDSLRLRLSMGHAGEQMAGHYASQAMRWRGLLAGWAGEFRLRASPEVARLTESRLPAAKATG